MAALTPSATRSATNCHKAQEKAAPAENRVNPTKPISSIRLRPQRSLSFPAGSSRAANDKV